MINIALIQRLSFLKLKNNKMIGFEFPWKNLIKMVTTCSRHYGLRWRSRWRVSFKIQIILDFSLLSLVSLYGIHIPVDLNQSSRWIFLIGMVSCVYLGVECWVIQARNLIMNLSTFVETMTRLLLCDFVHESKESIHSKHNSDLLYIEF